MGDQTTMAAGNGLPEIDLRQLLRMTDDTGILQHATYGVPDHHHGYCIDDNARALLAGLIHSQIRGYDERHVPLHRYLAFIAYALNTECGRFRNFMGYDRRWLEDVGSDDSHGRTLWALGACVELAPTQTVRGLATRLFKAGLPAATRFPYLRSVAFSLLGLDAYLRVEREDEHASAIRRELAERLFAEHVKNADADWPWWEDVVTYANAKLPQALLVSGHALGRRDMQDAALRSLSWLIEVQTAKDGCLSIIGNDGWMVRGGRRAQFDQQPLEAHALVDACLAATDITGEEVWHDRALWALRWFFGDNDIRQPLYDPQTGGCGDGLMPTGINSNQGAESSLALLLSVLQVHWHRHRRQAHVRVAPPRTLGYAIIGASGFAEFCLESYRGIAGLEPVAVWNRTTEKGEKLAHRHGLTSYAEMADLLADPRIQVVHVATTPAVHAQHAVAALQAGRHVLCEKPPATTMGDAYRMVHAAVERDRKLGINFMMRHGRLAPVVQEICRCGVLGALLRGSVTNCAGDDGLPADHWFWDRGQSGGIFIEHAVHFLDLVRSWLGEGRVHAAEQIVRPGTSQVDQAICRVFHEPQTTVSHYHGFHQSHHLDRQQVELIFERGLILLHGWVADRLEIRAVLSDGGLEQLQSLVPAETAWQVSKLEGEAARRSSRRTGRQPVDVEVEGVWVDARGKQEVYAAALRELMSDLLESVRQPGHQARVSAEDGLAALELAVAADRMARG